MGIIAQTAVIVVLHAVRPSQSSNLRSMIFPRHLLGKVERKEDYAKYLRHPYYSSNDSSQTADRSPGIETRNRVPEL